MSIGDNEDETALNVASLDAEAFVSVCTEHARQYLPETEQDAFTTGPRDRLREALYDRIRDAPEAHIPFFPQLVETGDEVFVERMVEALRSLITNVDYEDTTIEDWHSVVEGLIGFCEPDPLDTAWPRGCRQSVAELLQTIIGHERSTLSVAEHQTDLATVLAVLLDDPDPDGPTDTWNNPIGNTYSVYVKGVRATGTVAAVHFLRILHGESGHQDLQILWERLEELRSDPTRPVRFAFGKRLADLYVLDESFITSHLDTLLPEGEDQEALSQFTAVWEGYLTTQRFHPDLFEALRSKYKHAIDIHKRSFEDNLEDQDTNDGTEPDAEAELPLTGLYGDLGPRPTQVTFDARAFEPLCAHLACSYVGSSLELTDSLIRDVLTIDPSDLSAEDPPSADRVFADTFSDLLANTRSPESEKQYWERITAFWTERLEETDDTVPTALGQYAVILANAPPTASLDDVVEQLAKTAPEMTDSIHFRRVLEFLATEVEDGGEKTACDAMTVLDALVDYADQSYRFTASDKRWTVVTEAAAAGDDRALRIAEQFFQQGESEYERVIERHKTDSGAV